MCGITGKIAPGASKEALAATVRAMSARIVHRGPDEEGLYLEDGVALAMRRLAIIDLTPGCLPVANETGDVVVVFNGEIYNFREIRAGLEAKGHRFRTGMDTEVLVHLYEERGEDCVDDLRGMFAFALWDARKRRLLLARDRVGKKPCFFREGEGGIAFGSEIKALLADPDAPRAWDEEALAGLLTLGYAPAPRTCYRGVRELPPGHLLVHEDGQTRTRAYWRPPPPGTEPVPDAEDRLDALVEEAVRVRLESDVPLGAFLSGGIDSSLVVAGLARAGVRSIQTFSIGFDDPAHDEVAYARLVAEKFGTEHREFRVESDMFGVLPTLVWHHDGPFADSSAIPTHFVCRMAREHVTVALTGDGGDEGFAGYETYRAHRAARLWTFVPRWLRRTLVRPLLRCLPQGQLMSRSRRLLEFDAAADAPVDVRHLRWISITKPDLRERLVAGGPLAPHVHSAAESYLRPFFADVAGADPVAAASHVDFRTLLPGNMLAKTDRASMAVSLELRSPLLDQKVVEFACALPGSQKVQGLTSKALLKRVALRHLPPEIVHRKKQGFRVPVSAWFRTTHSGFVREHLLRRDGACAELLDRGVLESVVEDHIAGRRDYSREIFTLLTLELGRDMFLRAGELHPPS